MRLSDFDWKERCGSKRVVKPVVLGIKGTSLEQEERALFQEHNPLGFILFSRNIADAVQLKTLIQDLESFMGDRKVMILVDQEGGRVQRLVPPLMEQFPPMLDIKDQNHAYNVGNAIGRALADYGFNVDCAPVLDLLFDGASSVIGNRSFGADAERVSLLGASYAQGLSDAGIVPVIKHIPGHGRSTKDTHLDMARVDASLDELDKSDFVPFRYVAQSGLDCMAMMSHVIYTAIDPERPATLSAAVRDVVRGRIGFRGPVISDDICMKGLQKFHSDFSTIAPAMLESAVDIVLHCSADIKEMESVLASVQVSIC